MADEKVLSRADESPESGEIYSVAWWHSRTPDELRDIIDRGFAGGDTFGAALAESERRARQEMIRLREEATIPVERSWRMKFAALSVAIVALFAVLTVAAWWLVR